MDGQQFLGHYRQLKIGMPKSAVQSLFGKTPNHQFRLGRYDIWYYKDRGMFTRDFPANTAVDGSALSSASELPDTFGYLVLAFDRDGMLDAYTWIGETATVESRHGSENGSHFRHLPKGYFD